MDMSGIHTSRGKVPGQKFLLRSYCSTDRRRWLELTKSSLSQRSTLYSRCLHMFRSTFHQQALDFLLAAIEQHFPRSKRMTCFREAKQAGLLRAREQKKVAALIDESAARWSLLPDDILQLVFAHLEPLDLSRAACVNSTWSSLADTDSLWQKFLPQPCVASSSSESSKSLLLSKPPLCSLFQYNRSILALCSTQPCQKTCNCSSSSNSCLHGATSNMTNLMT